jgi:hypothetical protein
LSKSQARTAEKRNKRVRRKSALERARRYGDNMARAFHKWWRRQISILPGAAEAAGATDLVKLRRAMIERMSNWQRTQWNRAGSKDDLDSLRYFSSLMHWKESRARGLPHLTQKI